MSSDPRSSIIDNRLYKAVKSYLAVPADKINASRCPKAVGSDLGVQVPDPLGRISGLFFKHLEHAFLHPTLSYKQGGWNDDPFFMERGARAWHGPWGTAAHIRVMGTVYGISLEISLPEKRRDQGYVRKV